MHHMGYHGNGQVIKAHTNLVSVVLEKNTADNISKGFEDKTINREYTASLMSGKFFCFFQYRFWKENKFDEYS